MSQGNHSTSYVSLTLSSRVPL